MSHGTYIAGIDIGSAKVNAVLARVDGDGSVDVVCSGIAATRGIIRGVIVDMDAAAAAVREAAAMAERSSDVGIKSAHVSINGPHAVCQKSTGTTAVRGRFVSEDDIARAVESASTVYLPLDREIVHTIVASYALDGNAGIASPVGMAARAVEADVRLVSVGESALRNLRECVERAGIEILSVAHSGVAAARAVLKPSEMRTGAALLDMGAGTTTCCIYAGGTLCHAFTVPVGGAHITNDIAVGLRLTREEAERLKTMAGKAVLMRNAPSEIEAVLNDGSVTRIPHEYLVAIIRARIEEIFDMAGPEVRHALYHVPATRVVLTGGGAMMEGVARVAEDVFSMPVRVGVPDNASSLEHAELLGNPVFSTGIGLVLRAADEAAAHKAHSAQHKHVRKAPAAPGLWGLLRN